MVKKTKLCMTLSSKSQGYVKTVKIESESFKKEG